jgi:TonB-linked SusC/RagA family outer membrane protein
MERIPTSSVRAFISKSQAFIVLFFSLLFSMSSFSQAISVSGIVKDAKGSPLQGVSVKVKGTETGTTTGENGAFTIEATERSVLVFSFVGFVEKEEKVNNRTAINVSLTEKTSDLEDVVVIGYGQKIPKRDVGGAISSVSAKQIAERQPITLFDALQGQAAGVLIVNDNGEPGAQGSIQIRGANTFTAEGNTPLYIVDGVRVDDASAINPADIERVEVLKDASSASIYGARAAAGVILITTKKGREGKGRADLQYSHVLGKLAHKIQAANAADTRYYRKVQRGDWSGGVGGFTDSLNPSLNTDNDFQDLLLGNTGQRDDIKVGIGGGRNGMTYYGSLNYVDDRGIALNTWNKTVQSRINTEFQFSPKLKYSNNLSFYWQFGNFTSIGNSIRPAFDRPAYAAVYNPDGTLTSYLNSKRNPVANALLEDNTRETFKAQMNHQIDFQVYKDLKFTTSFNAQLGQTQAIYFQPRFLDDNGDENVGKNDLGKNFYWLFQSYFNYSKKINNHSFTGLIGFEKERSKSDNMHIEGKNFIFENVHYVTGANMVDLTKQRASASAYSTASIFGRIGYNFKDRYIAQFNYRNDASSRFGPNNKIGEFISSSLVWRFSGESFMDWASGVLNDGKIRVSWGQLGNDRVGNYEWIQQILLGENSYNGIAGASLSSTFGNNNLKWEATEQKNLGLDLSFYNGRLNITADAYIKTTKDLLYRQPMPVATGFTDVLLNFGNIETRGLEFVANVVPVSTKNFTWNLTGNITFERGRILSLYKHSSYIINKWFIEEGGKIGNFYGWKNLGIYQYNCSNAYTEDGQRLTPIDVTVTRGSNGRNSTDNCSGYTLGGKPYTGVVVSKYSNGAKLLGGDTEWEDVNNDGEIDDADRQVIGNAQPDYYLGIINTFTYKQFSLNIIVNATIGGQVYNTFKQNLTNNSSTNGPALPEAIYGAWNWPGDVAKYPYFPDKDNRGSQRGSGNSIFIEDASFIRLSSVRVNYRFKSSLAKKAFMNSASVYIYGTNLLTWSDYTGFDPEFSSSNALEIGDDGGKYPKRREIGAGITIQF